ncbi:unannotated protein [freshwater metagenome]|uniref:methionyl-tRNA formyltransferase n=1 Tax=freshwater metagenome TaxID=449393 RepID=A0A6J7DBD0_9ZZZZ|nr:methionyl-tRNA formyltransferase [Actinomycetota bacterium]
MRLAVAATPSIAIPTLRALSDSEHDLVAIITQPDRGAGRGKELRQTPVASWAISNEIPLLKPLDSDELIEISESVECVVTVGYGVILPESIINLPKHGYLNLHFSLLPKWRGAAPVQRAIQAGEKETGVSIFKLDRGMDTGPIYLQKKIAIPDEFRSQELFEALSEIGAMAVLETLQGIDEGVKPIPQSENNATIAAKISKEEARIEWNLSSSQIFRNIKAFYPAPIAWTLFRNEVVRIESAKISGMDDLTPGELRVINRGLHVGTQDGALEILTIVPAGKKSIDVGSWLNGARIQGNERFE